MPNKRKNKRKNATPQKRKAIQYVCCHICGQWCLEGAGIASHLRTCSAVEENNKSEQTMAHNNESMNGNLDTEMVRV